MLVRQLVTGVGGGAVLALFALLVAVPHAKIRAQGRELLERTPFWSPDLVSGEHPEVESDEREPEPEHLLFDAVRSRGEPSDRGHRQKHRQPPGSGPSDSLGREERAGVLVASLGEDIGSDPSEGSLWDEPEGELAVRAPSPDELDDQSFLGALSKQTIVRSQPNPQARILGFVRTGALLQRAKIPSGNNGCKEGWYRVEPQGYVCAGQTATLDPEHPIIRLASMQPDRSLSMPYPYGQSRYPTPPLYTRLPTKEQQRVAEQDLAHHLSKNFGALWANSADTPPPSLLAGGEKIPRPYGYPVLERDYMTGYAVGSSAFAFIDLFESEGRRWGLTADLSLLPLDRLTPVQASEFSGEVLKGAEDLPLAFVRAQHEHLYEGSPENGTLRPTRKIAYRESFHLTGHKVKFHGSQFWETRDGAFLKDHERLVRIEPRESMPNFVKGERTWIEVSILRQTLVAYRGHTPVFATMVSTGRDGLGDPETTHSTVQGVFLIHTKHVTSTMSGDEADDQFDLRDVPYVQFFHGGYAFHSAFWHDSFGQPRSHGCVNLSPDDARHLFSITEPPVPRRWHSALSREGTLVYIHP